MRLEAILGALGDNSFNPPTLSLCNKNTQNIHPHKPKSKILDNPTKAVNDTTYLQICVNLALHYVFTFAAL